MKTQLFTLATVVAANSFLEANFGPILGGSSGDDSARLGLVDQKNDPHQHSHASLDDEDDLGIPEFVKIPPPDYVGDLDPAYAPLYARIPTFAHLPLVECFGLDPSKRKPEFDIAIVGAPFDTGVSYRSGSRFGPSGIRDGSRRLGATESYSSINLGFNPYADWATVVDCGDAPMTPFDNRVALNQLYRAHRAIHKHNVPTKSPHASSHRYTGKSPRIITLGGDHTVTFSALRSASQVHGPVSVIHFDSHIDTWDPSALGGNISSYANLNHGTFLHYAHEKGYLVHDGNMHVGVRAPFIRRGDADLVHDRHCGFDIVMARDIDKIGVQGIADRIKKRVGNNKVYISIDIDVLDPAYAPGTGTAEPGGYTTREFLTLLDLLQGLNIVGADIVEVAPAYDTNGQITVLAAAQIVDSLLELMIYEKK